MACSCKVMAKVLERLGAKHAAKMHRELGSGHEWSNEDWLLHFDEEERYVLPYLPKPIADRIYLEHEIMRAQIKIYGKITNKKLLDEHAQLEDRVVLQYLSELTDGGVNRHERSREDR